MNRGVLYAVGAYISWGLLPIYWKAIQVVPAHEILCHRMVWSLAFILIVLMFKNHWTWVKHVVCDKKTIFTFILTGILLSLNWYTYIWAVNSGFIVDASLGYFINPLFTVLLGVTVLNERPRFWQWISIGLATIGVLYLTLKYGSFPWIALVLAATFGLYGLIRKTAKLEAMEGLSIETALMFIPAFIVLIRLEYIGIGSFGHLNTKFTLLLAITGVITILPLYLFTKGVRLITLTTTGLLHYITPTLQFIIGVFLYAEIVPKQRLIGFTLIWIALLIFTCEGIIVSRKTSSP